jgi:hypothetical protein
MRRLLIVRPQPRTDVLPPTSVTLSTGKSKSVPFFDAWAIV